MNIELYDKLFVKGTNPALRSSEWRTFLEFCEVYLKRHKIKNPIVVELGVAKNRQKLYYKQLLGATHIGIDIGDKYSVPDIQGSTRDPATLATLKERLGGRSINILFIDANHSYESIKKDFEIYEPLCSDIVALHDIESGRYDNKSHLMAWRFWGELREARYKETEKPAHDKYVFISIHECHIINRDSRYLGIGMMIKRGH